MEDKWAYDRMIRVFQQRNPGMTVEFIPYKATEYNTILSSALTAGKGPDIIHLRAYGGLETFAAPGFILPLDTTKVPELRRFPLQTLAGARSRKDGQIYGVPFATQTLVIYYNKQIFAQHNLSVPRSWDEFLAVLRTLKQKGVLPLANGGKEGWTLEVMAGVLTPNFYGGTSFYEAVIRGHTTFKDPRFTNTLAKLLELRPYMADGFMGIDYVGWRAGLSPSAGGRGSRGRVRTEPVPREPTGGRRRPRHDRRSYRGGAARGPRRQGARHRAREGGPGRPPTPQPAGDAAAVARGLPGTGHRAVCALRHLPDPLGAGLQLLRLGGHRPPRVRRAGQLRPALPDLPLPAPAGERLLAQRPGLRPHHGRPERDGPAAGAGSLGGRGCTGSSSSSP